MDAEVINNTATAAAIPAQGAQFSETASTGVPINPLTPSMTATLVKQASPASFTAVGEQIFGGVGFMEDHDMPLYFKRAKAAEVTLGDSNFHREIVARQLDL